MKQCRIDHLWFSLATALLVLQNELQTVQAMQIFETNPAPNNVAVQ